MDTETFADCTVHYGDRYTTTYALKFIKKRNRAITERDFANIHLKG